MESSIVAVGNGAGVSVATNRYDENGIPGTANVGRFAYTGQIFIRELGIYHYKARIYSPTLGRFLQTYDDQINPYAYVANDPVNHTDPTGEECSSPRGGTTCRMNPVATAATAATTVAAREGVGAERAWGQYREATGRLAPNDSAGLSAAKASARAATPPITRGVVEGVRPGLGPKDYGFGPASRCYIGEVAQVDIEAGHKGRQCYRHDGIVCSAIRDPEPSDHPVAVLFQLHHSALGRACPLCPDDFALNLHDLG